jgi:hypothetical protein
LGNQSIPKNKLKMKKIQIELLLSLGLAGVGMESAQAQATYNSDLIVGFTSTTGNDTLYDLGAVSSLTNGKTWDLSSLVNLSGLSTVNWGVVASVSSTHTEYLTETRTPNFKVNGLGGWGALNTPVKTIYSNFSTAGAGNSATPAASYADSWNIETLNPTIPQDYLNATGLNNPNTVGETSVAFWSLPDTDTTATQFGTFSLDASGVVTFNTVSVAPPVPKIVSLVRSGGTDTIYFTTTSGSFTYTLYYTNAAGLTAPITNWTASPTTLIGNGNTNSLTDTSSDANRFYRIGVH